MKRPTRSSPGKKTGRARAGSLASERIFQGRFGKGKGGSDPTALHVGQSAGGDLGGTYPNPTVPGLTGPAGGDLSGNYPNPTIDAIRKIFPVRRRLGGEGTDDNALAATFAAAAADGGGIVVLGRDVLIEKLVVLDAEGVGFDGRGCTITATDTPAGLRFGAAIGNVGTRLGTIGNFTFDGAGIATKGVVTNLVNGEVEPIVVANLAAGVDGLQILGQNTNYYRPVAAASGTGFCFVLDNGAGGNNIYGSNAQGGNEYDIRQTVNSTGYGYAVPQDNKFYDAVGDNPVAGSFGVRQKAGAFNVFVNANIFHRSAPRIVSLEPSVGGDYTGAGFVNGRLYFSGRTEVQGDGSTPGQIAFGSNFVGGGGAAGGAGSDIALVLSDEVVISGIDFDFKWGSSTPVEFIATHLSRYGPARPFWTADGSGAWAYPVGLLISGGLAAVNAFPGGPATFSVPVGKVQGQTVEAADGASSVLLSNVGGVPVIYFSGVTDLYSPGAGDLRTGSKFYAGLGLDAGLNKITQGAPATAPTDFVIKSQMDAKVGAPTLVASGETFTVPANRQVLYSAPIQVDGTLVVDGRLVEVGGKPGLLAGQVEIDFGPTPVAQKIFTVTDPNVNATSKLTGQVAYEAPSGRQADEVEMEPMTVACGPGGAGQFSLLVKALEGRATGKFKVNYTVAG